MTHPGPTRAGGNEAAGLVEQMETGARRPGPATRRLVYLVAVSWSLFQLWIVSPLPFWLGVGVIPETQGRSIHLAFAVFLAFLLFPGRLPTDTKQRLAAAFYLVLGLGLWAFAWSQHAADRPWVPAYVAIGAVALVLAWSAARLVPLARIPMLDWVLALLAAWCAGYLFLFHQDLATRPGRPLLADLIAAGVGLLLLLEATRRVLGPALMVIAGLFLVYAFAGPWMPDLLAHRGASFARAMAQQWLSNEGVFGIALGVSTSFVFLFVLFGALLERAGAGGYFIRVAFALLGHLRGGPAKAAVAASAMTGLVSGSSIANVVTTGTFTVPLMKRTGFTPAKAGAVEVASSVNGQLMPPVMGAAAFLMVEYVGIPYVEVIKHAFLPALIAYIALFYIVHLEAAKAGLAGLPRASDSGPLRRLIAGGLAVSGFLVLAGVVYFGLGWIKSVAPEHSIWVIATLVLGAYLALLWWASRVPPPPPETDDLAILPAPGPTLQGGLHFLLPVIVLIWCLVVERLSPGLSAFWAILFLVAILLTQRPLIAWFRGEGRYLGAVTHGARDLVDGLAQGARNMIGIGVATAAAGIIVGTVAMTGIALVMTDLVEWLSGGLILPMLILTALICLVLGLGLPTTANYIIVATLMAPVIVALGAENGLLIPLIAAHLFVFYFGIMADVTPPVGLASFAAAAVARANPIQTGIQALWYSLRTITLPFVFIFNPQLLLIGVHSGWQLALTFAGALIGMLAFAAATQHYLLTRNRVWETAALLLIALTLFVPGLWMDRFQPAFSALPASEIRAAATAVPASGHLRLEVRGWDLAGDEVVKRIMLPLGESGDGHDRLTAAGLGLVEIGDRVSVGFVRFGSPADRLGLEGGWQIEAVLMPAARPAPEWFYVPALALLALVVWRQRRRLAAASP